MGSRRDCTWILGLPGFRVDVIEFHVLQHASAALDDVRRQEFLRAGAVMREHGSLSTSTRTELTSPFCRAVGVDHG